MLKQFSQLKSQVRWLTSQESQPSSKNIVRSS